MKIKNRILLSLIIIYSTSVTLVSAGSDFDEIVKEWAENTARSKNTKVRWIDLNAEQQHLREQYPDKKVNVEYLETVYDIQSRPPTVVPSFLLQSRFDNDTSVDQTQTFRKSLTTTDTFKWSVTEGLKVGAKTNFKVGFKGIADGKIEASTEINFSSNQEKTTTTSDTWGFDYNIKVPAKKSTVVSIFVDEHRYQDIQFTSKLKINGYAAVWFEDKINIENGNGDHWLWFLSPAYIINCNSKPNYVIDGSSVIYTARGNFNGIQGISVYGKVKESPLDDEQKKTEYLDIDDDIIIHANKL